jgi:hypothetical protein
MRGEGCDKEKAGGYTKIEASTSQRKERVSDHQLSSKVMI